MTNKSLEYIFDSECYLYALGYYVKGHQDKQEFANLLLNEVEIEVKPDEVDHTFCRKVPAPKDSDAEVSLIFPVKPGRGAFPVTIFTK